MDRYWFCEGVDEAWMTKEGDASWERTVEQYAARYAKHPGGPYYLASEVDALLAELKVCKDRIQYEAVRDVLRPSQGKPADEVK